MMYTYIKYLFSYLFSQQVCHADRGLSLAE